MKQGNNERKSKARTAWSLIVAFAFMMVLAAGSSGNSRAIASEETSMTGHVTGWIIAADGSVAFRLENRAGQTVTSAWFKAPANQGRSAMRFEQHVLDAVLRLCRQKAGPLVTVTGERDAGVSGKSPQDAIELLTLGQGLEK